jgi:hypothetical protein
LASKVVDRPGQQDCQPDGDQRHHQVFHCVVRPPFSCGTSRPRAGSARLRAR